MPSTVDWVPGAPLTSMPEKEVEEDIEMEVISEVASTIEQQSDASLSFIVAVRVRPESESELINPRHDNIIRVLNGNVLVFDPKTPDDVWERSSDHDQMGDRRKGMRKLTTSRRSHKDTTFAFDCVFDASASQQQVYDKTGRILVDSVFNGFNSTVFAYGATGSGKTVTMVGDSDIGPGLMILSMRDIFDYIERNHSTIECRVQLSYLEVYNEEIKDLLVEPVLQQNESKKRIRSGRDFASLMLREDPEKGVFVAGLSVHEPTSAVEVFDLLAQGNLRRTQCPTDANSRSSRSHAVLQVSVAVKNRTATVQTEVRIGKLSLVDLAGSERAAVTKNRGSMLREGANINQSLLALGNCINALCKNTSGTHVPFRNSKLTRLLKDSLGGNCRTVMIANISPSSLSYDDTQNTLKYSNRAKNIKTNVKANIQTVQYHVTQYKEIIRNLHAEIRELKQHSTASLSRNVSVLGFSEDTSRELRLQCSMRDIRKAIQSRLSTRAELESKITNMLCKIAKLDHRLLTKPTSIDMSASPCPSPKSISVTSLNEVTTPGSSTLQNRRTDAQCLVQNYQKQAELSDEQLAHYFARSLSVIDCEHRRRVLQLEVDLQLEKILSHECSRRLSFQQDIAAKTTAYLADALRKSQMLMGIVRQQHNTLERRGAVNESLKGAFVRAVACMTRPTEGPSLPSTPRSVAGNGEHSPMLSAPPWITPFRDNGKSARRSRDDSSLPSPTSVPVINFSLVTSSKSPAASLSRSISFTPLPNDVLTKNNKENASTGRASARRKKLPLGPSLNESPLPSRVSMHDRRRSIVSYRGGRPSSKRLSIMAAQSQKTQAWAARTRSDD